MRVAVNGATGRMGRLVCEACLNTDDIDLVGAFCSPKSPSVGTTIGALFGHPTGPRLTPLPQSIDADVVIDFSTPAALEDLVQAANCAIVSGTTGCTEEQLAQLADLSQRVPVLLASNFSTGLNVLLSLVERAARALPSADIEIIEAHHRHKVDSPSGTALSLGEAAASGRNWQLDRVAKHGRQGAVGARPTQEIGFHAIRGGDITGLHRVWLALDGERIELNHVASNRRTFALGAIRAAQWLHKQPPGYWSMSDVLGLSQ